MQIQLINCNVGVKHCKPQEKHREEREGQEAGQSVTGSQMGKITLEEEEHPDKEEEKGKKKRISEENVDPVIKSVLSSFNFCPLEG